MEKSNIEVLKDRYSEIQQKHNLPSFQQLNEDFGIEKIEEERFEILIREVRRFVADKLLNYMRFTEAVMNPTNASMFIFSLIKAIGEEEKKKLSEMYKTLAKAELELVDLDISYSEEKEAEFIRNFYTQWQGMKNDFMNIVIYFGRYDCIDIFSMIFLQFISIFFCNFKNWFSHSSLLKKFFQFLIVF